MFGGKRVGGSLMLENFNGGKWGQKFEKGWIRYIIYCYNLLMFYGYLNTRSKGLSTVDI